ncbi:MAG: helix-turn-helix domain-containing protein [Lachnospiraceae bacterium]|nr:helix-turn-helix domain-containing protein [Lachnospiraceae bacterium]
MPRSEKELTQKTFANREHDFKHTSFEREFAFYNDVKNGEVDKVMQTMLPLGAGGSGVLSKDPVRNMKYHFIVMTAMITRFCVEGGMEMETAYTLSDLYIQKVDKCVGEKEIHRLHREVVFDFTNQMHRLKRNRRYSKPVVMAMDYIYSHLHSKISEGDIAAYVSLSVSHLSRTFHGETGKTVSAYIAQQKVEAAKNMLRYSDYKAGDIGNYLAFYSHSHFISTFKKYTGTTPGEFRKKNYRTNWDMDGIQTADTADFR